MNKIREYFWEYLFLFLLIVFAVSITALLISMQQEAPEINHVGAVFIGEVDDAGWNQRHYDALKQLCADVSLPFDIIENIDESHDSAGDAITELVEKDCNIIFLTSDGFNNSLNDIYEKYPDISFYTASPDCDADNVVSYFGRMYQARYLSGIIAGGTTKSNVLGYVAGDDNIQVTRGINAFLLGARSINPDAVVEVKYTDSWDDAAAEQEATAKPVIQVPLAPRCENPIIGRKVFFVNPPLYGQWRSFCLVSQCMPYSNRYYGRLTQHNTCSRAWCDRYQGGC